MFVEDIPWRSPVDAFAPLAGAPHAHLLSGGGRASADWAFLVAFPTEIIEATGDGEAFLSSVDAVLAARARCEDGPAPLSSGLVGFVGYEALGALEPTIDAPSSPYGLPDASFGVYDAVAAFSLRDKRAFIVGRCENAARRLANALGTEAPASPVLPAFPRLASNFTRRAYQAAVADVIEQIRDGAFYQANLSQRIVAEADAPFSPFDLYRIIAEESDARFGALLQYDNGAVISNSPERFFRLEPASKTDRRIETEPIKGTRPRGADDKADAKLALELYSDKKDRAENIMIADLMRNDLSKICADGSIREDAICALMKLNEVHHLVSRVSGRLREDASVVDAFRALFPSGSITGAPKIAAINAIASIESVGRGPYCGAIGYIDDGGGADFSVAIRTMVTDAERRSVAIPVGGGVTVRSDPAAEYEETLAKAAHAARAFRELRGGLE